MCFLLKRALAKELLLLSRRDIFVPSCLFAVFLLYILFVVVNTLNGGSRHHSDKGMIYCIFSQPFLVSFTFSFALLHFEFSWHRCSIILKSELFMNDSVEVLSLSEVSLIICAALCPSGSAPLSMD